MNKSLRIACDGEAASGKSTGAKLVSKKYKLFLINSGLGYLFDRAVDTVTPMGSLMNLFGTDDECVTDREITVVLE